MPSQKTSLEEVIILQGVILGKQGFAARSHFDSALHQFF